MPRIEISILICIAAFWALVWLVRVRRASLGLPVAYLFGLLLIHVPGAVGHWLGPDVVRDSEFTTLGIGFTAIGALAFVAGVWLSWRRPLPVTRAALPTDAQFRLFCLVGGWMVVYGLSSFRPIPSIGAAIEGGGAVWMLGVLLGLRAALIRNDVGSAIRWLAALAVYPVLMLLLGGFLSYGSAAIIIVLAALTASIRSHIRVAVGIALVAILAVNGFLNYFQHRNDIRDAVWGGAPLSRRIDVTLEAIRNFEWFDPSKEAQINSLDQRLNQNYFVGLAAARIKDRQTDYLYGRSLIEGVQALVPRMWWPEKPVFAGSPRIVAEMTGLVLSDTTSFGVGNVMEFQINFGLPGVIGGFLILGWVLGALDRKAAIAEMTGAFGRVVVFFLPAVALIRPNGSLVEMFAGPASALVAAFGWKWLWDARIARYAPVPKVRRTPAAVAHPQRAVVVRPSEPRL